MLATAAEDGLISRNPAAGLRVVVASRSNGGSASVNDPAEADGGMVAGKVKRLTPEQTRALLQQLPPEHSDLVYLLATSGLRIGEALSLTWSCFSVADGGASEDGGAVLQIDVSKTAAGLRTLALSPETARRLTRRRSMVEHNNPADPIFASMVGTPLEAHNFRQRVFKPAARRAGVPSARPHQLRHGMASLMADQGYSASQIASQLGHADGGQLAMRVYIHSKPIESPSFIDQALAQDA